MAPRSGSGGSGGRSGPGERLAPVRYLFGAPASDEAATVEPSSPAGPEVTSRRLDVAALSPRSVRSQLSDGQRENRATTDSSGWYVGPDEVESEPAGAESAAAAAAVAAGELAVARAELAEAQAAAARVATVSGGSAEAEVGREHGPIAFSRVHKTAAELAATDPQTFSLTPTPRITFVAEDETGEADDEPKRSRVTEVSLNALARKGMSSAEMTRLLAAREVDPEEADEHVARLEAAGLLDDRALAENLVRSLRERKGLGRSAISAELRRRQVDEAAVAEALDAIDTDDELTQACEVAAKRAAQLSSYDPATAKRRLGAYLQRRGYSGSVLSAAMAHALDGPSKGPRFR